MDQVKIKGIKPEGGALNPRSQIFAWFRGKASGFKPYFIFARSVMEKSEFFRDTRLRLVIKNFATEMEAELAKNMLQANGIKSYIQIKGVHSSGIPSDRFGAELYVLQKDVEKAREIMELSTE